MAWYLNSINVGYLMPLCLYLLVPKLKVIRLTTRVVCKANTQLGSTLTSLRFALPYVKRGGALPQFSCFQLFLSNVFVNFHLEMQPGMLGTREPVTPCLAAQNPRRFLTGGSSGCAWKQASLTSILSIL